MKMNNNFIMISNSPWPIMIMISSTNMIQMIIFSMNYKFICKSTILVVMITMIMMEWFNNSSMFYIMKGYSNKFINLSTKLTMMLFIVSELMFFLSFFYTFLSNKMFSMFFMKKFCMSMFKLNFTLALMNLIVLLSSSITMMMFINQNKKKSKSNKLIFLTILLGMYFVMIQMFEYKFMNFNYTNSSYFSNFYTLTMFHMVHVLMGMMMMLMSMIIKMKTINDMKKAMMMTCWYWHFIDFIWIMIFSLIY